MNHFNFDASSDFELRSGNPGSLTTAGQTVADATTLAIVSDPLLGQSLPTAQASQAPRTEIVFIESNVGDIDVLRAGIGAGKEVYVLDAGQNGLQQIATILAGRTGVDALHIISHGSEGQMHLGSLLLNQTELNNYRSELLAIKQSLNPDADIILYGCQIGENSTGRQFVQDFAIATEADVAASDGLTGKDSIGGDWELEIQHGKIDTKVVIDEATQSLYSRILDISSTTVTFDTTGNFTNVGSTSNAATNVVYKIDGNSSYVLTIDGKTNGVGRAVDYKSDGTITFDTYGNNSPAEDLITFSITTGKIFSISSITFDTIGSKNQSLVFNGYAHNGSLVNTNNISITGYSGDQTKSLTGMTDIATLKMTATTNSNRIKFLPFDDLVLSNIKSVPAAPTVTLTVNNASIAEAAGTSTVTATLSAAAGTDTTVTLTATGTATGSGTDYTLSSTSITIQAGNTTGTATVTSVADALVEGNETVILDITGVTGGDGATESGTQQQTVTITDAGDTTAPVVSNITRDDTATSNATTVHYTVKFSESVTGVDTSDFALTQTGTASGTVSAISGSGDTYTVTVSSITGDGTLRLDLNSSGTGIKDTSTNTNAIATGFTSGETYTFDHTAPSAPSTPDMTGGTDTGNSSTDDITGDTTPTFIGTAEVGATVTLYDTDGSTVLGTTTANGSGKWSITASTMGHGTHSVTVKATDAVGNVSSASGALAITVVANTPTISSVAYNERAATLTVTGSDFVALASGKDIDASMLTFTGEGGTYTLTDTTDVELTNSTQFTLAMSGTDQAGLQQVLNKNGTTSFSGTSYKLAAAEGWDAGVAGTLTSAVSGKSVTVSGIATISSATYTAHGSGPIAAGTLTVTGTNLNTSADTVDPSQITLQILNGSTVVDSYKLTTAYNPATVTVDSTTQFSVVLNASDQLFVNGLLNNAGTTSIDGYDYNLNAAAGWNTSFPYAPDKYVSTPALTNTVSVDDAASPSVTSATFNAITHVLTVTGQDMVAFGGSNNDVAISKLTLTGAGSKTYTLTTTDVDVTSATTFSATLNSTDITSLSSLLDKDGTKAGDNTSYNLSAALNWNGQVATSADLTNTLTVTTPAPTVSKVIQTSGNGSYKAGDTVTIKVSFDQAVIVDDSGGTPRILLETGSTDQYASYVSGSGSADLVFSYVVQAGDTTADLQYFNTASFGLNGGSVVSVANGSIADLSLPGTSSGNSLAETSAVVVDTSAPSAPSTPDMDASSDSGTSNSDDYTADNTPTFSGTAEANATVYLYDTNGSTQIGQTIADGSGNWSITASILTDGSHTVSAKAVDAAGNVSTASSGLTVTIDTIVPTITINSMAFSDDTGASATDFITSTAKQDISGTLSANLPSNETVQISSDNGSTWVDANATVGKNTFSLNKQTLSGSDTLKVRVIDLAGNTGSAKSQAYTIDTSAPSAPSAPDLASADDTGTSNSDNNTSVHQPHFTGTAEVAATVYLYDTDGTTVLGHATVDGSGNYDIVPDSAMGDGSHTLTVKAVDAAGNTSSASPSLGVTIRTAPTQTVSSVAFSADTGVSATDFITSVASQDISGTLSSVLASGQHVEISLNNASTWASATSTVGKNTFSLTGQTLTASNTMKVKVVDDVGNESTVRSDAYIFDPDAPASVTVKLNTTSLKVGATANVTITFSEKVGNFDNNDISVENGTLSAVSSSDGGLTWTGVFTPTDGIEDAINVIKVDKSTLTGRRTDLDRGVHTDRRYRGCHQRDQGGQIHPHRSGGQRRNGHQQLAELHDRHHAAHPGQRHHHLRYRPQDWRHSDRHVRIHRSRLWIHHRRPESTQWHSLQFIHG